jgi:anti-sigma regulatory factor (Ser/Thr protein kinase)
VSDEFEFRLANDLAAMAGLAEAVERFAAVHRLPPEVANALYVGVDEAVSNAIAHGYPGDARGEIAVRIRRRPDSVVLEIEDDGAPFDPLQAAPPDLTLPLDQRPVGGLGIHLIRNLMDEVSYMRQGGKNGLKLVKHVHFQH